MVKKWRFCKNHVFWALQKPFLAKKTIIQKSPLCSTRCQLFECTYPIKGQTGHPVAQKTCSHGKNNHFSYNMGFPI